ncbi:MAG: Ig-like domain-containing protein [Clostridia bacterium]|nr:Ig-like domain-containing protein [Clostridia bacterium]
MNEQTNQVNNEANIRSEKEELSQTPTSISSVANAERSGYTLQQLQCTGCGSFLSSGMTFCPQCGKNIWQSEKKVSKPITSNKVFWVVFGVSIGVVLIIGLLLFFLLKPPAVEKVEFDKSEITLRVGETEEIKYAIYPEGVDVEITFSSSNHTVATVTSTGKIIAKGKGNCTITVKCGDKSDTLEVKVKNYPDFKALFKEHCKSAWAEVGSDGSYLEIDTNPNDYEDYFISVADEAIEDINKAIGLPDSLYNDMLNTSYNMGRQTETFEDFGVTISWTYHPNYGLEVVYKIIE